MLSRLKWLEQTRETRQMLADTFGIQRRGVTNVDGGRIVSDGYRDEDIITLTTEKMQAYLESESTDFYELFDQTVNKLNAIPYVEEVIEPVSEPIVETSQPIEGGDIGSTAPRGRGRPKANIDAREALATA